MNASSVLAFIFWLVSSLFWLWITCFFFATAFMFGDTIWQLDWSIYPSMGVFIFSWFLILRWPFLFFQAWSQPQETGNSPTLRRINLLAFTQLLLCFLLLLLLETVAGWLHR